MCIHATGKEQGFSEKFPCGNSLPRESLAAQNRSGIFIKNFTKILIYLYKARVKTSFPAYKIFRLPKKI